MINIGLERQVTGSKFILTMISKMTMTSQCISRLRPTKDYVAWEAVGHWPFKGRQRQVVADWLPVENEPQSAWSRLIPGMIVRSGPGLTCSLSPDSSLIAWRERMIGLGLVHGSFLIVFFSPSVVPLNEWTPPVVQHLRTEAWNEWHELDTNGPNYLVVERPGLGASCKARAKHSAKKLLLYQ